MLKINIAQRPPTASQIREARSSLRLKVYGEVALVVIFGILAYSYSEAALQNLKYKVELAWLAGITLGVLLGLAFGKGGFSLVCANNWDSISTAQHEEVRLMGKHDSELAEYVDVVSQTRKLTIAEYRSIKERAVRQARVLDVADGYL